MFRTTLRYLSGLTTLVNSQPGDKLRSRKELRKKKIIIAFLGSSSRKPTAPLK